MIWKKQPVGSKLEALVSETDRFIIGVNIAANTDLNDITTPGVYCCANADTARTCSNCPVESAFSMYVSYKGIESETLTQVVYCNGGLCYFRGKTTNGFSNWALLPQHSIFANALDNASTASIAVAKNEYVFYNGILRKATSPITQGESNFTSKLTSVSGGVLNMLNSKLTNFCVQTQVNLPSSVSIPAGESVKVLDAINLRNLTVSALDTIPSNGTICGIIFLWANGSVCTAVDTLVASDTSVTLTLFNMSARAQTVSAVRLLVFLK